MNNNDRSRRPGSSRRQVLAGGATALSLLGLSPYIRAAGKRVDVAIVGAGLSGLYAGMLLSELGASVTICEASNRPGGRCQTADDWLRTPDLGGAQIGTGYARVLDVCQKLGVELGPGAHINAPYTPVIQGQMIPSDQWAASPLNRTVGAEREIQPHTLAGYYIGQRAPFAHVDAWRNPDQAAEYDISVAAWLKQQGASPEAMRLIRETRGGGSLNERGVLRMFQEATRMSADRNRFDMQEMRDMDQFEIAGITSSHVVGGTSRLTDAMAASLGQRVRLGQPVQAIEQDKSGCTLRCADGSKVQADFAIVAVPFSVLRSIDMNPALQGAQAEAVRSMNYNNQSQVWLEVKAPYWEDDGLNASMWTDGQFSLIRQQIESDGSRVLISALSFGDKSKSIDAMSPAERGKYAIAEIERIRPSTRGKLAFVGAHSWEMAEFQRGCSFELAPGRALEWANSMAKPHGRLHFAGEHLRSLEVGMEGAMESGQRVSLEIALRMDA